MQKPMQIMSTGERGEGGSLWYMVEPARHSFVTESLASAMRVGAGSLRVEAIIAGIVPRPCVGPCQRLILVLRCSVVCIGVVLYSPVAGLDEDKEWVPKSPCCLWSCSMWWANGQTSWLGRAGDGRRRSSASVAIRLTDAEKLGIVMARTK